MTERTQDSENTVEALLLGHLTGQGGRMFLKGLSGELKNLPKSLLPPPGLDCSGSALLSLGLCLILKFSSLESMMSWDLQVSFYTDTVDTAFC